MKNKNEKTSSRTFTLWIKTLAYLLSILLIFYAVPANVYAELIETVEAALDNASEETIVEEVTEETETEKAVFEVTDRREETVKHFRTEDGSFTAVQYGIPVHEKDENGKWQDIDNTISDMGNEYGTSNARVKFAKKTTGNETLFTLHNGNRKITMSLSGANKKVAGQVTNTQTEFPEDATQLQKLMTLDKLSSKILYPDILDGVDLEYVVNSGNIKENIIVKERADSYSYTFEVKLNNLDVELCEDGSIVITDPDTEEVVYTIPKGYMYDAADEYSDAVTYTLDASNNGKYSLTVTADAEWINAEGRAFPVTVDPPINVTTNASYMTDTQITDTAPNTTYYSSTELRVGHYGNYEYMSFWKTSNLPTLPDNAYLVKACFMMDCIRTGYPYTYTFATKIGVYNLSSSNWTSGLTWNNRGNSFVADDNDLVDFADIEAATDTATAANWVSWDITSLYTQWLSDPTSNHGLALVPIGEKKDYAVFSSANSTTYIPCIIVEYRDMKGIESYWSGSTHSAGLAGGGFVNHATGNLVFSIDTLATGDNLFGYTPSLIYNAAISNQYNIQTKNPNVHYKYTSTGLGLKLSTNESIVERNYIDPDGATKTFYVWSDGDGTEHYFLADETDQTGKKYKDEDGLGLTLTVETSNYYIEDLNHNVRRFTKSTGTEYINAGGVLEHIQDQYGNKLRFNYGARGQTTSIDIVPSGHDEAIEYLTFAYNSIYVLYEIRNSLTGHIVQFEYGLSYDNMSLTGTYYAGPLYRVKYGHLSGSSIVVDATATYEYVQCEDGIYRLSSAKDETAGVELRYTYDSLGRVKTVTEFAYDAESSSHIEGQSVSYTYGEGYIEIRSSGTDDILQPDNATSDDIITHCSIDSYGRSISEYSTDADRNTLYGAAHNVYDENYCLPNEDAVETNENAKNEIKAATVVGGTSANYIYNGGFSYDLEGWSLSWTPTDSHLASIPFGHERYCLGIPLSSNDTYSVSQSVSLPKGSYTLSAACFGTFEEGTQIRLKAISQNDTSRVFTSEYTPPENISEQSVFSPTLTFTAERANNLNETFTIIIEIICGSSDNGIVYVDDIMLENNIGASAYNTIQFGSFEETVPGQSLVEDYWNFDQAPGASIIPGGLFDGNALRIQGDLSQYQLVSQPVVISSGHWTTPIPSLSRRTFTISGFAKGSKQIANESAYFSLNAIVTYSDNSTDTFYFDFNKSLTDWQFLSGTFSTDDGKIVMSIEVECEYDYQPGEALFDGISLVEETGNNTAMYKYNDDGLLEFMFTPSYSKYCEYDDSTPKNLKTVYDTNGQGVEYTYNNNTLTAEVSFKYDTDEYDLLNWYFTEYAEGDQWEITTEAISKTFYNINAYGLNTGTQTYRAMGTKDNVTIMYAEKRLYSTTTYELTKGSKLFGKILTNQDTSGYTTTYQYDGRGQLIHEINNDNSGLCYFYDTLGRMTAVYPLVYMEGSITPYYANTYSEKALYTYASDLSLESISTASTDYTFEYDAFGNTTKIIAGNSVLATYEYAPHNGKLEKMIYGNGKIVTYTYDELDRVKEICYNDFGSEDLHYYYYTYTATGAIHSVECTETGRTYTYNYNTKGQLINNAESNATKALLQSSYWYDDQNRLEFAQDVFGYATSNGTLHDSVFYTYTYDDSAGMTEDSVGALEEFEVWGGSDTKIKYKYYYDKLYRLRDKLMYTNDEFFQDFSYVYRDQNSSTTTRQLGNVTSSIGTHTGYIDTVYSYEYDNLGNITKIIETTSRCEYDDNGNSTDTIEAEKVTQYKYDDMGQLTREDNPYLGKTYTYTYDNAGNRTSKKTYAYTTGTLGTATSTQTYTYSTGAWGDQLSGYTYDEIGNPSYYNGYALTWSGRALVEMNRNYGQSVTSFTYNDEGIRTSKNVGGTVHTYILNGSQIVSETWGQRMLLYFYDESGAPMGLQYRQSSYAAGVFDTFYFEKNIFGDIVAVYTEAGVKIGTYTYDAWGNCTTTVASGNTTLQSTILRTYNPFRYRGYFYDTETGLYYLQSRYYNPATGRFLNPDTHGVLLATPTELTDKNLYAYCDNNPVMRVDYGGMFWDTVFDVVSLCFSVVEVVANPADPWAWVGCFGDLVDLVPGITGVGETAKALGAAKKAGEILDDVHDTKKAIENMAELAEAGQDGYKTFKTAKKSMEAVTDIEWHHLVEQSQIRRSGLIKTSINNSSNLVGIDRNLHQKISALYSSKPSFLKDSSNFKTVRDWVSTLNYQQQYTFGVWALQRAKYMN
ncbi:MAG: RHS repeat-associated core domain-containing protein [Clostridia bacterium]|nr:RHS repeat-associated core domain-containing protein [Clostridia bacterium]